MRIYVCAGNYETEGNITEEGNLTHEDFQQAIEVGRTIRKKYGYISRFITSPYLQARETTKALREACRKKDEHPKVEVDIKLSKRIPPSMKGRLVLTSKTESYDPPLYETKEEFQRRAERQYNRAKKELKRSDDLVVYITHKDFLSVVTHKPSSSIQLKNYIILQADEDSDSSESEHEDKHCEKGSKKKKCGCRSKCNCKVKCRCEVKCRCKDRCRCEKRCCCNEIISPYPPGCQPPCPPICYPPFPVPCPQPCFPCQPIQHCPQPCPMPCPPKVTVCIEYQQPPCNFLKGVCPDSPFIKRTLGGKTCCYCYQISCVCR